MLIELTHWYPQLEDNDPAKPTYHHFLVNPEDVSTVYPLALSPSLLVSYGTHPARSEITMKTGVKLNTLETYEEVKKKFGLSQ
jgi:hypothetical protein